MPLALLVINPHQHLAAFDTGPTSALRTGRFLKGVYFKMQASFMLLCGNNESPSITKIDCISAAASSVSSRFLSQYVKVRVGNQSEISSIAQSATGIFLLFLDHVPNSGHR
ncbi:hypothetical protein [Nitrobacter sp. JJSN]|uniref:hypothetical protein n=1 Tax=Nitrobacter sp. JJSN TaxID=3453033 RepID=UPI003F76BACA